MNIREIYKIADSKESYNKEELLKIVQDTSQKFTGKRFKDRIPTNNCHNRITILFPIYNEEDFLKYSLTSFFESYAFGGTSYQVVFFLNSCTDNSMQETTRVLNNYKTITREEFNLEQYKTLGDPGLNKKFLYAKDSNAYYYILDSKTKGRVNALRVATTLANMNNSQIIISFDSDFILDPLAIYTLSKESLHHIAQRHETVAITGSPIVVNKDKGGLIEKFLRDHLVWADQKYNSLSGCCLVLDTAWLSKNLENNIIEDYTLGVKVRSQGYKVLRIDNARMWGYRTNYKDDIKQLTRSIKGRYQLLQAHPEFSTIVISDHFFMRSFPKRISYIIKAILENPKSVLKWCWTFLFVEICINHARKEFELSPQNIDWEPLSSGR